MFRLALEAFADFRILRRDTGGTCVVLALTQHHAAKSQQQRSGETEFLRAEQGRDDDVAACAELSIYLQLDFAAQVVLYQCLMCFGQTDFPRHACMFDGTERRGSRAAVVPGNDDHIGMSLRNTRRDCADTVFGDKFHGDSRGAVGGAEVVN